MKKSELDLVLRLFRASKEVFEIIHNHEVIHNQRFKRIELNYYSDEDDMQDTFFYYDGKTFEDAVGVLCKIQYLRGLNAGKLSVKTQIKKALKL